MGHKPEMRRNTKRLKIKNFKKNFGIIKIRANFAVINQRFNQRLNLKNISNLI